MKTQNNIIEEVLDRIKQENPQFDIILSRLLEWWCQMIIL